MQGWYEDVFSYCVAKRLLLIVHCHFFLLKSLGMLFQLLNLGGRKVFQCLYLHNGEKAGSKIVHESDKFGMKIVADLDGGRERDGERTFDKAWE